MLKTLVGFANSVKPDHVATILIGEKDDGSIQGVINPENIQQRVRKECDKIYPPILCRSRVYEKDGKHCVRVEIEYDGETPHFGGSAWVRKGSNTIISTDDIFQRLIDLRSGIVCELAKWLNKVVTIQGDQSTVPPPKKVEGAISDRYFAERFTHRWQMEELAKIVFVNNYWVTFEKLEDNNQASEPLSKLTLSYDDERKQLKVIIVY